MRNNICTLCESLGFNYLNVVMPPDIISCFKSCSLWCKVKEISCHDVIRTTEINYNAGHEDREAALKSFLEQVQSMKELRHFSLIDSEVLTSEFGCQPMRFTYLKCCFTGVGSKIAR